METTTQAGRVTFTASATSTVVQHYGCSSNSHVTLTPTNAAAGTEFGAGTTWIVPAKGFFTINHASSAGTRTYTYSFVTPKG